jgi:hypothetical protein
MAPLPPRIETDQALIRYTTVGPRGPGTEAKATASGTNRGSVERMDRLDIKRPNLTARYGSWMAS